MFDLKTALRDGSMIGWSAEEYFDIIMKASLEIERLEAENKRLQGIIFNLTGADG